MKLISRSTGDETKRWPAYVFGGRMRTSTIALIVAFFFTAWLYETYQPPPEPPPITQTVPPGFVPDPEYTWVPRTQLQERPRTTYPTTTTPTTTQAPTTSTTPPTTTTGTPAPGDTPGPEDGSETVTPPTTTVFDPDGPGGLLPPITLPVLPGAAPAPTPPAPATPPGPVTGGN